MDKINDFDYLVSLWKDYNNASLLLTKVMGGTANEVGEFAEKLICKYYNAKQLNASNKSADLITEDGKLIQVKSRKIGHLTSTNLNVIRSWDFNILVVVLFSKDGNILKAIEIDSITAKELSKNNPHQNGDILTTSKELLENIKANDITKFLQNILDEKKYDHINNDSKISNADENILFNDIVNIGETEEIKIKNIIISRFNRKYEKLQDYIKRVLHLLFDNCLIPDIELNKLQDTIYCKETFFLYYPLLEKDYKKIKDSNGYSRYWTNELFGNKYYVCKEWWKQNEEIYYTKFIIWLKYISKFND
jgi:hypothetical protein